MRLSESPIRKLPHRPFLGLEEIEERCLNLLIESRVLPTRPEPVDLDLLVESHFGIVPDYTTLPQGIQGCTLIDSDGKLAMKIDEDPRRPFDPFVIGRSRATMAHEIGHLMFHVPLCQDLGGKHRLCRDVVPRGQAKRAYQGEWEEFQANQAIGPLTMPRPLVPMALETIFRIIPKSVGRSAQLLQVRSYRDLAIDGLAGIFQVNRAVAKIRLKTLYGAGS